MNKAQKQFIYERNMKILPFTIGLLATPFHFFIAIYMYYISNSFFVAGLAISFCELTKIVMEIPTGVLSDKYLGRKYTQVVGYILQMIGMGFQLFAVYDYRLLFVGMFFSGSGLSFFSGNINALVYDSLSVVGKENEYHKKYAILHYYRFLYMSISILVAGALAHYFSIFYVMYFCLIQRGLCVVFGIMIKEPYPDAIKKCSTIKSGYIHILISARKILKTPKLRKYSILYVIRRSLSAVNGLGQIFYKTVASFLYLGILFSANSFISSFFSKYSQAITKKVGFLRTFVLVRVITVPTQIIGYLMANTFSPIIIELGATLSPVEESAQTALLQKEFSNKQRATMESVLELIGSLGYAFWGALLGWLAEAWSLQGALLLGTSLKLLIIPVCLKVFKN